MSREDVVDPVVLEATERLTGLAERRILAACERVTDYGIRHLTEVLVHAQTVDGLVAAVLLADSIESLTEQGVEHSKLLSKLRKDPDVWPTWAELRAAHLIGRLIPQDAQIRLEVGRSRGRHADFQVSRRAGGAAFGGTIPWSESSQVSIEFKALGLSDEEAAFCQRARPTLEALRPRAGFVNLHAPLDMRREGIWMDRATRRHGEHEAARFARRLPPHARSLSGAFVSGQGAEGSYVARLRQRFAEAFDQLPVTEEAWVAFHWSNGAPFHLIAEAVNEIERPPNLLGVALVGSAVAFPYPDIHNFVMWAVAPRSGSGEMEFQSSVSEELGRTVFDRIEQSSGVRACVVRATLAARSSVVLLRDGTQRILPFVFLGEPDPVDMIRQSGLIEPPLRGLRS
jgi:hypothetical protein